MSSPTVRVLIVDDAPLVRTNLRLVLEKAGDRFHCVGEAETGEDCLSKLGVTRPDLVLMDIGMPLMDGITATRILRQRSPHTQVVMFTTHEAEAEILSAFGSGATSYCLKDNDPETLLQALETTAAGDCWIDPKIARVVLKSLPPIRGEGVSTHGGVSMAEGLTERERDVLKLVTEGMNNTSIADRLCISLNTVKTHLKNIFQKLAVEDRTGAALKALKGGLV